MTSSRSRCAALHQEVPMRVDTGIADSLRPDEETRQERQAPSSGSPPPPPPPRINRVSVPCTRAGSCMPWPFERGLSHPCRLRHRLPECSNRWLLQRSLFQGARQQCSEALLACSGAPGPDPLPYFLHPCSRNIAASSGHTISHKGVSLSQPNCIDESQNIS